jgi:hypothetical protein
LAEDWSLRRTPSPAGREAPLPAHRRRLLRSPLELLGKAVLWNASPALLVPLQAEAEASLFILVERPDLDAPKLRTVGLKIVLGRLETLGLPIDGKQRTRMVDTRNGAMHIGSAEQSRFVLIDALTLCVPLLAQLGKAADWSYGDHKANADGLVQESAPRSDTRWRPSARRPACC